MNGGRVLAGKITLNLSTAKLSIIPTLLNLMLVASSHHWSLGNLSRLDHDTTWPYHVVACATSLLIIDSFCAVI